MTEMGLLKVVSQYRLQRGYPSFKLDRMLPYRSSTTGELVHAIRVDGQPITVSPTALRMMVRKH